MQPNGIVRQADPFPENVNLFTETSPVQQPEELVQDGMPSLRPRMEEQLMQAYRDIPGAVFDVDSGVTMRDSSNDMPPLGLGHGAVRAPKRVLQAPVSTENAVQEDYMSLEVDELQALKDVQERARLINAGYTRDRHGYVRYRDTFKDEDDIMKMCSWNGFGQTTSAFAEDPMFKVDTSDIQGLERIDGIMNTKDMMKEMEGML